VRTVRHSVIVTVGTVPRAQVDHLLAYDGRFSTVRMLTWSMAACKGSGVACENGTVSGQAARYQRSAAGMIGAMLILIAVIVGFVVIRDLNRSPPQSPVEAVDYQQSLAFAREQATFKVLAPETLPTGWEATTVEFTADPSRWHLGLLTDQDRYVGLEQAQASVRSMVTTYVAGDATPGADVSIDGQTWRAWSDPGGDAALVRTTDRVTTLVVGTADQEVLVGFVESLR